MLWETLVLAALAIGIITFVLWPLWRASRRNSTPAVLPTRLLDLFAERDAVIAALRDLQLDYDTGKMAARDYEAARRALLLEAARILRDIEAVQRRLTVDIDEEIAQLRELARQLDTSASTAGAAS